MFSLLYILNATTAQSHTHTSDFLEDETEGAVVQTYYRGSPPATVIWIAGSEHCVPARG
jgi:hypothetical protein